MPTCADDELIAELRRGGERADRAIAALSAELAAARAVPPTPTPAELDRDTSRLNTFSDGVFAISITLLVLDIRVPEHIGRGGLLTELAGSWSNYLSYVLSFVIVGVVWSNHHTMFTYITRSNHTLRVLNLLLMMNIASLPFTAALLARYMAHPPEQQAAVLVYSGTLVVGGVIYNALWRYAVLGHRLVNPDVDQSVLAQLSRRYLLGPILYGAAFGLALISPPASIGLCIFLAALYLMPGFAHRG